MPHPLLLMLVFAATPPDSPPVRPSIPPTSEQALADPFNEVSFNDDRLKQVGRQFEEIAKKVAQPGWRTSGYQEARGFSSRRLYASWQSSHDRPSQVLEIAIDGTSVHAVTFSGRTAPTTGWGASVTYRESIPRGVKEGTSLDARVSRANPKSSRFSFDLSENDPHVMSLTVPWLQLSAHVPGTLYFVKCQLPDHEFAVARRLLYGKPEEFRDQSLADIEGLRADARQRIETGKLEARNMIGVSSARPPHPISVSSRPLSAETKQALLTQLEERLGERTAILQKDFREIHAAIQQALPIAELLEQP